MDKNKQGRPTQDIKRDYKVTIRLGEEERCIVEAYCRKYLVTQSEAIRDIIQKYTV
jgi:hypothetical protein